MKQLLITPLLLAGFLFDAQPQVIIKDAPGYYDTVDNIKYDFSNFDNRPVDAIDIQITGASISTIVANINWSAINRFSFNYDEANSVLKTYVNENLISSISVDNFAGLKFKMTEYSPDIISFNTMNGPVVNNIFKIDANEFIIRNINEIGFQVNLNPMGRDLISNYKLEVYSQESFNAVPEPETIFSSMALVAIPLLVLRRKTNRN